MLVNLWLVPTTVESFTRNSTRNLLLHESFFFVYSIVSLLDVCRKGSIQSVHSRIVIFRWRSVGSVSDSWRRASPFTIAGYQERRKKICRGQFGIQGLTWRSFSSAASSRYCWSEYTENSFANSRNCLGVKKDKRTKRQTNENESVLYRDILPYHSHLVFHYHLLAS